MYRIIGGKQQQCDTHYTSGAKIILENFLFWCLGKQKIKPKNSINGSAIQSEKLYIDGSMLCLFDFDANLDKISEL